MQKTITIVPEKDWLTTAEAASVLGVDESTVQKKARKGILKWKLAGRADQPNARLYETKSIRAYLDSRPEPSPRSQAERVRREAKQVKGRQPLLNGSTELVPARPSEASGEFLEVLRRFADMHQQLLEMQRELTQKAARSSDEVKRDELRLKDWLTPGECYRLNGMRGRVVVGLAENGSIDAERDGKSWLIRRASLEEFSQKGAQQRGQEEAAAELKAVR